MNDFVAYSAAYYNHQNYLMHYGILGMKWGVRRYQNEDGTLTDAGLKRYAGSNRRKLVRDSILLAEKRLNVNKNRAKRDYENNKMDEISYKQKRKELRREFRQERKNIRSEAKKLDPKELNERFKAMRSKAINEIPNYKVKRGAQMANKIITGVLVGRGVAGTLTAAALYTAAGGPALGIASLVGGALGTAAGGYAGYKVRNKIRRQFT